MRIPAILAAVALTSGVLYAAEDPLRNAPKAYREAMIDAMRAFTARDFDKAAELVRRADGTNKPTPMSLNMLGAIEIERKRFEQGREYCMQALKIDPKFFPARFNLAEIPFIQ